MNVTVIGVGHVGLVTAATLPEFGHNVAGIDDDVARIEMLREGRMPFFEPGLQELVAKGMITGRLRFTSDFADAMSGAEVVFSCVGTPGLPDGALNLAAVEKAARSVIENASGDVVLVQKSTVPVHTADRLGKLTAGSPHRIRLAANPEFLREGTAVADSISPGRILVGAEDDEAHGTLRELYQPFFDQGARYFATDLRTAELAKHACNAFLAVKISFANALAEIAEASGADVLKMAEVMGADPRIGRDFLDAGIGYGGSCLPKDVAAFKVTAAKLGYDFGLLEEVMKINRRALETGFEKIQDALWNLQDKRVLVAGLAFKEGTDDLRESPGLALALRLVSAGADVVGHDPHARQEARRQVVDLRVEDDFYAAAEGADCVAICIRAPEYAALDLVRLKGIMARPLLADLRNLLDPELVREAGFACIRTGRPAVNL